MYHSFYEDIIISNFYIVSNNVNCKSYGIVGDKLDGYYIDLGVSSLVQGGVLTIVLELYKANYYSIDIKIKVSSQISIYIKRFKIREECKDTLLDNNYFDLVYFR